MVMAPRTDNGCFLPDDELLTAPSRCGSSSPLSPILLQLWAVFIGPTTTSYNVGIQPWPSGLQRRLPAWVDLKFGWYGVQPGDPLFTNQPAIEFSSRFWLSMYSQRVH